MRSARTLLRTACAWLYAHAHGLHAMAQEFAFRLSHDAERRRQREGHLDRAGLLPGDEAARAARAADRARQEAEAEKAKRRAVIREWAEEQQQLSGGGGCAAPRQLQAAAAAPGLYSEVSRRLMSSMGWNGAGPLGRRGEGQAEPVMAVGRGDGVAKGLGFVDTADAELLADYLAGPVEEEPLADPAQPPVSYPPGGAGLGAV